MTTNNRILATATIIAIIALIMTGCAAPLTKESTEKEIVTFMLDVIIKQEIKGDTNYALTDDLSSVVASSNPVLIILKPTVGYIDENDTIVYFIDKPIKAWLYGDNKLTEAKDSQTTAQKYNYLPTVNFGIYSISSDYTEAKIFLEGSCGPLCGHGDSYAIQKNDSGVWEVKIFTEHWIT